MWNRGEIIENLTKPRIVELFNTLSLSLYRLYQDGYTSRLGPDAEAHLQRWLQIDEKNVFLDDEIDVYLEKLRIERSGNCEFHYYDYHSTLLSAMTGQKLEPIIIAV